MLSLALLSVMALNGCPQNLEETRTYLAEKISDLQKSYSRYVLHSLNQELETCKKDFTPETNACLAPYSAFLKTQTLFSKAGHSLNLPISDEEYYQSVPFTDFLELPDFLKTQEFLKLVDGNDADLDKALEKIAEHNKILEATKQWVAFRYESVHLPTPDGTKALGRFFVYVPGDHFDRYLQFGLRHNELNKMPHGLSMVSVQKVDPVTLKKLPSPKARIKDFWRKRSADGVEVSTRLKEMRRLENCYECHKHALLPITPNAGKFDKERFGEKVKFVNAAMSAYSNLQFEGVKSEDYGPPMGPAENPARTDEFIKECSSQKVVDPARIAILKESMQCANCHDGSTRGALNFPSILRENPMGPSLVEFYITRHKQMPLGENRLTDEERTALVACLKEEYYGEKGLLASWLQNDSCWNK